MNYYFDTYALVQIAKGAPTHEKFKETKGTTTLFNLYELYYILCKDKQESLADTFFELLIPACVEITPDDIKQSAQFRLANRKSGVSYVDALGYSIARRRGLIFLTGDDAFEGLDGVEFVK